MQLKIFPDRTEFIALADRRLMLSHGYYSVISPEGAAAIEGGLKTCFVRSGPDPVLAEAISTCLYRILQEALTNIVKHARANAIHVVMRTTPQSVSLEVKDNGRGFDIHALRRGKGIGLIGMEERLLRCGGELRITSAKGRGTCLLARVPRAAK